jgi:hypothetical protein
MAKWWMGIALLAFGTVEWASAQQAPSMPNQGRPVQMPEPIPFMSAPQAPMQPGPMQAGAMQPDSPLSLPSNLPTAWDEPCCYNPCACYASIGYFALQREKLGHSALALLDTASGGVDTGEPPPKNAPLIGDFNDLNPRFNHGVRGMLGYHWGTQAVEMGGFYLTQNSSSKVITAPGRLDTFFFNPPLGFEGTNGLWLQADLIRTTLRTALGSGEVNYRWWPGQESCISWSLGVRYLDIYERLNLFTGDDDLTVVDVNGNPDPRRQATYTVTAHNRLLAPQLGLEWNKPINCWLAFTWVGKGAWGANFLDVNTRLLRGNNFSGGSGHRGETIFSHLYETSFALDVYLLERARLRAGYNLMLAADVAESASQLDFNLANKAGRSNNHGSIFYHGPMVELHLLF